MVMESVYAALNPIGERDLPKYQGIGPRIEESLNGKTIGLFDNAKRMCPFVLARIEKLLVDRFPQIRISWFRKRTYKEILWDQEAEWAKGLDGVIGMCGD